MAFKNWYRDLERVADVVSSLFPDQLLKKYEKDGVSVRDIFCKIDQYQNYLKSFPTLKKPS